MRVSEDEIMNLLKNAKYIYNNLGSTVEDGMKRTGIRRGDIVAIYPDKSGSIAIVHMRYEEDMSTGEVFFILQ